MYRKAWRIEYLSISSRRFDEKVRQLGKIRGYLLSKRNPNDSRRRYPFIIHMNTASPCHRFTAIHLSYHYLPTRGMNYQHGFNSEGRYSSPLPFLYLSRRVSNSHRVPNTIPTDHRVSTIGLPASGLQHGGTVWWYSTLVHYLPTDWTMTQLEQLEFFRVCRCSVPLRHQTQRFDSQWQVQEAEKLQPNTAASFHRWT